MVDYCPERLALWYAAHRALPTGTYAILVPRHQVGLPRYAPILIAKASNPDEQWITLHPDPSDREHYVRVLIKRHSDGTGHVISGGGSLRGLKLSRLGTPEEWAKKSRERRAERAKKKKEREAQLTPEQKAARETAKQELSHKIKEKTLEQINTAAKLGLPGWEDLEEEAITNPEQLKTDKYRTAIALLGIDPSDLEEEPTERAGIKGGAGLTTSRITRKITTGLKRLERNLMQELAQNEELRESVLEGTGIKAEEVLKTNPSAGKGFQDTRTKEALAAGMTPGEARKEAQQIRADRLQRLSLLDPEKAEASITASEIARNMHSVAGLLRSAGEAGPATLSAKPDPAALQEHAKDIKTFLRTAQEVKQLERQARQFNRDTEALAPAIHAREPAAMNVDITPTDEEFIKTLKQSIEETKNLDLTRSFFNELNATHGEEDASQKALINQASTGAYTTLNATLLSTLGSSNLDRSTLDTLGLEATTKLAAWRLQQNLTPEKLQAVREGLAEHHEKSTLERMSTALKNAQEAKEAASSITLPDITNASTLAAAKELNDSRRALLKDAISTLGTTLGEMEAGAALNLALKQPQKNALSINFPKENDDDRLITSLAALGLEEGDYDLERTTMSNTPRLTLHQDALEKLTKPDSAQEVALRAELNGIRAGAEDEPNWLPAGFVSYPTNTHNDPSIPEPLAMPPTFERHDTQEALTDFVASRLADGWLPSDILREAGSIDFVNRNIPTNQRSDYLQGLKELFPVQDEKGKLKSVDTNPELREKYQALVKTYMQNHHPEDADLHSQSINPNDKNTRRAAFLALSTDPRTQSAWKPREALTPQDQQAIRQYYLTEIAGVDAKTGRDKKRLEQALKELGSEPEKHGTDLFGGQSITPEWSEWNQARQDISMKFAGPTAWEDFVRGMRGLPRAYQAVQDHMRSKYAQDFQKYYGNLTGSPIRLGVQSIRGQERFSIASNPEARAEQLKSEQARMAGLRERKGGKFAEEGEGSVIEKLQEHLKQKQAFNQIETSLFGNTPTPQEKPTPPSVKDALRERYTLGERAEAELSSILPVVAGSLKPTSSGVRIPENVTMGSGTKFVPQQRAIKFAKAAKKTLLAMGMGCVHGSTMLEDALTGEKLSFEEWHQQQISPHVWALDEQTREAKIVQASPVFIKGTEMMHEVTTVSGRHIIVTKNHKFLTPTGWEPLHHLEVGTSLACHAPETYEVTQSSQLVPLPSNAGVQPVTSPSAPEITSGPYSAHPSAERLPQQPQKSCISASPPVFSAGLHSTNSGFYPSKKPVNDPHYSRKAVGSRADYPQAYHSCDAQLHEARGGAPSAPPGLTGALARNHQNLRVDAAGDAKECTPPYPQYDHPAIGDSLVPAMNPSLDSQATPILIAMCKPSGFAHQKHERSPNHSCLQHEASSTLVRQVSSRQTDSPFPTPQLAWTTIKSIIPVGKATVYDVTVPHYHNYLAHGIWHHNSGKTGVQIATLTELQGEGKAKKGLFVVPSVVRNQFGEEMSRFTEPGKYAWSSDAKNFQERLAAYQNPDMHMSVVTHQAFRDDMTRLLQRSMGYDTPQEATNRFESSTPQERRKLLRTALRDANAEALLDYVAMDEAHEALGRAGKPDSLLQAITDATLQEAKYAVAATGTPIKNDASEAYDWLRKLNPDRWEGKRDEFNRRYGLNLPITREAFQREVSRNVFSSRVPSGANRTDVWGATKPDGTQAPLELTAHQQKRLTEMNTAFERARLAARTGKADVEAMRALSPNSFTATQTPEEQQEAAERLASSLGTLRFAAEARIINDTPATQNAKIQHLQTLTSGPLKNQPGVIFAHSLTAVKSITEALKQAGHHVVTLTGGNTSQEKGSIRQAFNPDQGEPTADILVASDAGAVGMNLQRGKWLINYDLPLTHKTLAQRNARIDRVGQKNPIQIHNLITSSTYDRLAAKRLQRKQALQDVFESGWDALDDSTHTPIGGLPPTGEQPPLLA